MADQVQTFSLNTDQAVAAMQAFVASTDKAAASVSQFVTTAKGVSGVDPFTGAVKGAKAYGDQVAETTRKASDGLKKTKGEIDKVGLSWQAVGRIVQTQLIIRGINELRDLFFEASDAAAEFEITLARIAGITDGIDLSSLETQLKEIAVAAGRDVNEVASAALEAFQNDIGTTEETVKLLGGAISDLAIVTQSDFTSAVNTLTPIIKAYDQSLEKATETTGKIFSAIDSGIIVLEDFNGNLGTVTNLAAQLELPIEQVFAAIATGTLAGVDATKSMTQLRNVLVKMTKPTDELKAAFNKLEVDGFTDLIKQGLNFREVIDAIFTALDRDPERFAKAFNTIRAQLGGVAALLDRDGEFEFDRVLEASAGSAEQLAEALKLVKDTDAFAAQENAAEFSRLIADIGKDTLQIKNVLQDFFIELIPNVETARVALGGAAAAAGVYAASLAGIVALGPGLAVVGTIVASALIGVWIGRNVVQPLIEYQGRVRELEGDLFRISSREYTLEIIKEENVTEIETLREELEKVEDGLLGVDKASEKAFKEMVDASNEAAEAIEDNFARAFTRFASGIDSVLGKAEAKIKNIQQEFEEANDSVAEIQQEIAEFNFQESLKGLPEATQLLRQQQRAVEAQFNARKAINDLAAGKITQEEAEAVVELAQQYTKAADEAERRAKVDERFQKGSKLRADALELELDLAVQIRNNLNEAVGEDLQSGLREAVNLFDTVKEGAEALRKEMAEARKDGVVSPDEQKKIDELRASLKDKFKNAAGAEIFDVLALENEINQLTENFETSLENITVDWSLNVENLRQEIANTDFTASVELLDQGAAAESPEIQQLQQDATSSAGATPEATDQFVRGLNEIIIQQETLKNKIEESEFAFSTLTEKVQAAADRNYPSILDKLFTTQQPGDQAVTDKILADVTAIGEAIDRDLTYEEGITQLQELSRQSALLNEQNIKNNIPLQRYNEIQQQISLTGEKLIAQQQLLATQGEFNPELLEEAKEFRAEAEAIDKTEISPEVDAQPIENLSTKLETASVNAARTAVSTAQITPAAGQANGAVGTLDSTTNSLASSADSAAGSFNNMAEAAIRAAQEAANALSAGAGQFAYSGGQVKYRAAGGDSRGQDTISAMLAPEEFVVNPRSSRNFFSELQAINGQGGGASSSDSGGTTINVGDININNPSQVPTQTAREVGQSIQRELRRRTFKL